MRPAASPLPTRPPSRRSTSGTRRGPEAATTGRSSRSPPPRAVTLPRSSSTARPRSARTPAAPRAQSASASARTRRSSVTGRRISPASRRTAACSPRRGEEAVLRDADRRLGARLERPRVRDPVEQERESVADRRLLDHTGDSDRPAGRARRLVLPRPWPEPVASEEAGDDVVVAGSTPGRRPALPHRPPLADCEQTRTEPRSNAHRRSVSFGGQRRRQAPVEFRAAEPQRHLWLRFDVFSGARLR